MAVVNPPAFLQNAGATHTAEITRGAFNGLIAGKLAAASLKSRGGVAADLGGALAVTQNGTPNMTVLVDAGVVYVPGSQGAKQGTYVVTNDASLSVAIAAADASLGRIDLIVAKVEDTVYSGGVNSSSIVAVTGTPAGSPAAPAAPNNSVILAQISVPALDTTIGNAQITDRRPFLAAAGATIRCTSTNRPATSTIGAGQQIYETDTKLYYTYDGANFAPNPGQLIKFGVKATDETWVNGGGEVTYLRLDNIPIVANVAYIFETSSLLGNCATAGDTGNVILRGSTSGTAGTASPELTSVDINANSPFASRNSNVISWVYQSGSNQTLSLLISISKVGGTANFTLQGATRATQLRVMTVGTYPGDTGVSV